jgi:hypothetical protein
LPLLLISGVVLIAIAGVTLWQVIRAPKETAPTGDVAGVGMDEARRFEDLAAQPKAVEPAPKLSSLRAPAAEESGPKLSALREPPPSAPQKVTYRGVHAG